MKLTIDPRASTVETTSAVLLPTTVDLPRSGAKSSLIGPTLEGAPRAEFITRESILTLLSDDEVASVSTAETKTSLDEGEEFIDLERIERGVQLATIDTKELGGLLPKKSVHDHTWAKILTRIDAAPETQDSPRA